MVKAFFSQEATEFGGQMGCMATMFQIFDHRRLLTGRRHGDCPGTMDELPPAAAGTSALLLFHYYFAICSQLKKPSILAYKKTKTKFNKSSVDQLNCTIILVMMEVSAVGCQTKVV